jgi:L-ribulose-5-phosphate 3-epimerase
MHGADRFVVSTKSYAQGWTVEACLKHLNDQGFNHFALTMAPGFLWPGDMDKSGFAHFQRFLAGHRLRIVALNLPAADLDITAASPETRAYALDMIERYIEVAGGIGARGVVIGVGQADPLSSADVDRRKGHVFAAFDSLWRAADRSGTALWVQTMPSLRKPAAAELIQLLDSYGDDRIGIVYDVADGWFVGEDMDAALRTIGKRLKLVHVSDTHPQVRRHDRVGLGSVPFQDLPPLLAEVGYADWPVLDILDPDPDAAIGASVEALLSLGFGERPTTV